ncbi:gamma-glutamylcyclotransferase family protein [Pantanalinema rosaneae CENA516]|uniref:gamma-glutamylcyclotransferase family protein n=1 Tax=Pantanalinema rosaneae TaxID=1620701 RepID=UPI003D6EF4B1
MDDSLIHLFVYGTLQPGERNYRVCEAYVVASQPAIVQGCLYQLPFGYPALTLEGDRSIHGMLFSFTDPTALVILDQFEQHDPIALQQLVPNYPAAKLQYQRRSIPIMNLEQQAIGTAWAYLMTNDQVDRLGGVLYRRDRWQEQATPLQVQSG